MGRLFFSLLAIVLFTSPIFAENRDWKVTGGKYAGEFRGSFNGTKNGVVAIIVHGRRQYTDYTFKQVKAKQVYIGGGVSTIRPGGVKAKPHTHEVSTTNTILVPLKLLSRNDRQWVEENNAAACALSKKSAVGDIGTLSPKDGTFYAEEKVDAKTAIMSLVVNGETTWRFALKSKLTKDFSVDAKHENGGLENIGKKDKIDFVVQSKKAFGAFGELLPVIAETD